MLNPQIHSRPVLVESRKCTIAPRLAGRHGRVDRLDENEWASREFRRSAQRDRARKGYDNQPSFTAKGDAVLYTATDEKGKTDTWRFSLPDGKPMHVTTYPMNLYSPTWSAGLARPFSAIGVEPDS